MVRFIPMFCLRVILMASILIVAACQTGGRPQAALITLDRLVPELLEQEKAAGVGIAAVRDGEIAWTRYYGLKKPGVPLGDDTLFNTASLAKTITAEVMIELSIKNRIDLDEPISDWVTHTDLATDPRYEELTPRLLLSHRAGLLNWAYVYDDGKLAFDHDPGTRFSYSGAGFELAARYAQSRTGQSFSALAQDTVFQPGDMVAVSLGRIDSSAIGRMAQPMDSEGAFRPFAELNPGLGAEGSDRLGAADDLLVTLPAYARFIARLAAEDDAKAKRNLRETILTSLADDPIYACPQLTWLDCPERHGHSIGWQVFDYGDHSVITHSGSDAGENALAYYSPETRDGAVIFVNGANGWFIMTRIVEAIGEEPEFADYYRALIETVMGRPMPPLEESSLQH